MKKNTQGSCTQTNLKQYLTFIENTNSIGSSLEAHTHPKQNRGGLPQTSVEIHPTVTLAKNDSFYDAVKITSLLCAHIFWSIIILMCKARTEQPGKSAGHYYTYEATGLNTECWKYWLMSNLANEVVWGKMKFTDFKDLINKNATTLQNYELN